MDLSKVKTTDLLNELSSRPGVERTSVGPFAPYELTHKYSHERGPVIAETVLIIKDSNHLADA